MSQNRLTLTDASLNPPSAEMVHVTVNGQTVEVPKGENIIEAAKRLDIDIPFFCYHPRLSKGDAANCRMCLVDVGMKGPDGSVRMMPKPQTACTLPASEGMVVQTESPGVIKDRRGILEFLLINHPLDCPICDRGGECPLQNNTLFYGPSTSRFVEEKRHFPKAYPLSDYVVFDRERCIHCARCTRFTEDISGDHQLGFLKRGADMEVGTYAHTAYSSKFSGNVIELCPVGALLSRTYRFRARPWDLLTQRSICSRCSNGCNVKLDYRLDQLQRVNARVNEEVNEEWTCDRGKFGHDYVSSAERILMPRLREGGAWREISWQQAYEVLTVRLQGAGGQAAGIGGARLTNEDNFLFQKLFREVLRSPNLDSRMGRYQGPANGPLFDLIGVHGMGNTIADIEQMNGILVLGSRLVDEQPMLYLRVRKAWRYGGASVINAASKAGSDSPRVGDFAAADLVYTPGSELAFVRGLTNLIAKRKDSSASATSEQGRQDRVRPDSPDEVSAATGVPVQQLSHVAALLERGPVAIIAGREVVEHPDYAAIAAALCDLLEALGSPGNLNVPGSECNSQGAMDMGMLPDMLPGYRPEPQPGMSARAALEAAAAGKLPLLWIAGADPAEKFFDADLAKRALAGCPFVVVNELKMSATASAAHLVLPAASVAEKDGTYTNCERRVQRIFKAFDLGQNVKPDWLIFSEVSALLGGGAPAFSAREVLQDIARTVPIYSGMTPAAIGDTGRRWSYPASSR